MLTRTRSALAAGTAAAVLVALAGCGNDDTDGDDKPDGGGSTSTASASAAPAAYLEVPEGVELTEPGTALALGEEGVVAFEVRQDEVAVLGVSVDRIEQTTFAKSFPGWTVDDATATRTPYFVRVSVTNQGEDDLAGLQLANVLWGNDGVTLEAANHYTADQLPACPGGPLPTPFATDAATELCLVYFIAGGMALEDVSFLPFGGLDAVTWSGETSPVGKPGKKRPGGPGGSDAPSDAPSGSPLPSDAPTVSVPTQDAT